MTRPVVRRHRIAAAGATWYVVTASYPTDKMGKDAYDRIMRRIPRGELGIYRHGLPEDGGTNVSAVSLDQAETKRVARLLGAGADLELPAELVEAMIFRRARVVAEAAQTGQPAGRLKIKHAGRGAFLDPSGRMHERGPGQG